MVNVRLQRHNRVVFMVIQGVYLFVMMSHKRASGRKLDLSSTANESIQVQEYRFLFFGANGFKLLTKLSQISRHNLYY